MCLFTSFLTFTTPIQLSSAVNQIFLATPNIIISQQQMFILISPLSATHLICQHNCLHLSFLLISDKQLNNTNLFLWSECVFNILKSFCFINKFSFSVWTWYYRSFWLVTASITGCLHSLVQTHSNHICSDFSIIQSFFAGKSTRLTIQIFLKITVSSDSLVVVLNFIIKFLCLSIMLTLDCDDTNMNSLSRQYALLGSYQQIKWDPTKQLINDQQMIDYLFEFFEIFPKTSHAWWTEN